LASTACGGGHPDKDGRTSEPSHTATPAAAPAASSRRGAPANGGVPDWRDPEPPDAQELAESVLNAPFNADKIGSLAAGRRTRLVMHITTLVDRTTGITGFATTLAPEKATLQDRLSALGAKETATEVTIRLPGAILFDFDSSAVRPDAERTLGEVVKVLKSYSGRPVRVEGHTDSIASEAYNQKLSEARAASVAAWLTAHGIAKSRLRTGGWGETRPVADNSTAEGRQRNRRVEIIIEKTTK